MKVINRFTENYTDTNGNDVYRIYSSGNPHYYQDTSGSFYPIEQSYSQSMNNSKVGDYTLFSKNIYSLGIRNDGNTNKYIGIRPDNTQELGTQQLEWGIEEININNNNIIPDLNNFDYNNSIVNLGNIKIQSNRKFIRQMVHYTSSIDDFKIKYKLNLTGLKISNNKYSENTIVRNFTSASLIDCGNISGSQYSSITTLQTHSESILSMYFTDDTIIKNTLFNPNPYYSYDETPAQKMSGSEFVGNTGSFHFIDRDKEFWGYHSSWDYMSSGYLKDSIYLKFKDKYLANTIKDHILTLTNSEIDGNYIREIGGKKIGAYIYPPDENTTYLMLCLKDITHMSSSFRYKSFDDLSYTTMSYSDIISSISTKLNSSSVVTASTTHYQSNENGDFIITDNDDNFKYRIGKPILLDSKFNLVTDDTTHTLKDNGDGTYEYIKYPSENLIKSSIPNSVNYIDAVVYSAGSDGWILNSGPMFYWSNQEAGTQGTFSNNSSADSAHVHVYYDYVNFKSATRKQCRSYLYFDTSGITNGGQVNKATLNLRRSGSFSEGYSQGNWGTSLNVKAAPIIILSSSNDLSTLSNADWGGLGGSRTKYTPGLFKTSEVAFEDMAQATIDLNDNALNNAVNDDTLQMEIMEFYHSYGATGTNNFTNQPATDNHHYFDFYTSDYTGTTRDPYLEVYFETSYFKINSGTFHIKGGKFEIG
tara:strand:+ start:703 stop:2808 length:2106 start_codon:yes stop_codon:yes gene_type:complete